MNSNNVKTSSLMQFLEVLMNFKIEQEETVEQYPYRDDYDNHISRGLPSAESESKEKLKLQLLGKKKRDTMVKNVDLLKDLIQKRNEEASLIHLAQIINQVTTTKQKNLFMKELGSNSTQSNTQRIAPINKNNPEYIPYQSNGNSVEERLLSEDNYLKSRSAAPLNGEIELNSLNIETDEDKSLKCPLTKYNPGELYLIYKGIFNCRLLLSKFFKERDKTIVRELNSRNILYNVLHERIENQKSYIMQLVDNYPESYQEIKFILRENQEAILKSPIFVHFAQRKVQYLYDFLSKLVNDQMDKNELSKCCNESVFNDTTVAHLIKRTRLPEDDLVIGKIETFINRYKEKLMN